MGAKYQNIGMYMVDYMRMRGKLYSIDMEEAIALMMGIRWKQTKKVEDRLTLFGTSGDESRIGENRLKLSAKYGAI